MNAALKASKLPNDSLICLRQFAAGRAAAVRLHAVPEERVVPDLGGVVEHAGLIRFAGGLLDDFLERKTRQRRAGGQFVQVVHVGLVMLAVVEPDVRAEMCGSSALSGQGRGGRTNPLCFSLMLFSSYYFFRYTCVQ